MLKKKQRLTKKMFDHVFSTGVRKHSPTIQLIHVPGEIFYGAAVVGKKVHKKAVDRNKLRRRMYAALYRVYKEESLTGTYILVAKSPIKEVSTKDLIDELKQVLLLK